MRGEPSAELLRRLIQERIAGRSGRDAEAGEEAQAPGQTTGAPRFREDVIRRRGMRNQGSRPTIRRGFGIEGAGGLALLLEVVGLRIIAVGAGRIAGDGGLEARRDIAADGRGILPA